MDYMEKITELRAQKSQLAADAEKLVTEGKFDEVDAKSAEMEKRTLNALKSSTRQRPVRLNRSAVTTACCTTAARARTRTRAR